MPKALEKKKLCDIVPTADELAKARQVLASPDEKKKASLKGSLRNFVKANADDSVPDGFLLKDQVAPFLERFIVNIPIPSPPA